MVATYRPVSVQVGESNNTGRETMNRPRDAGSERYRERERRKGEYVKQLPGMDDELLPPPAAPIVAQDKHNRNDPCPCGSGKKYKKCCSTI